MHLTLLESDRSFFRTAECATVSIVAHLGLVWVVLATATGTFRLPTTERDAPSRSIFCIRCGSTVSDELVPSTIRSSSLM